MLYFETIVRIAMKFVFLHRRGELSLEKAVHLVVEAKQKDRNKG